MRINYPEVIRESEAELAALEQQLAGQRTAIRVRMLRLLKTGSVPSLRAFAASSGYSVAQVNRWWQWYQQQGLAGLTTMQPRLGKRPWVSPEVWAALQAEVQAGRIKHLEDARQYLQAQWGIEYRSTSGVWALFKQHGVRLKTGRERQWQLASAGQASNDAAQPQAEATARPR